MDPIRPIAPADRDPKLVFVGVPSYGDPLRGITEMLTRLEIQGGGGYRFICRTISNQGLAKGRNILAYMARCTPASKVVMMDGDIVADPGHILRLLSHPEEVVGALYPKKQPTFQWVGEFFPAEPSEQTNRGLWPALSLGTGLIRIDLSAIDRVIAKLSAYESEEDMPRYGLSRGQLMHDLFPVGVRVDNWFGRIYPRYLTEDYGFSYLYRQAGGRCWADSFCQAGHIGRIDYLALQETIDLERAAAVEEFRRGSAPMPQRAED